MTSVELGHRTFVADGVESRDTVWWRRGWWAIPIIWAVPATFFFLQAAADLAANSRGDFAWPWAATRGLKVYSWCLTIPITIAAGRRWPLTRTALVRHVLAHVVIIVGLTAIYESVWFALYQRIAAGMHVLLVMRPPLSLILGNVASDGFMYAAVLAVAMVIERDRRLGERDLLAANLQTQVAEAQVQALKMHVHPHFLFNALHAVTVMISEAPTAAAAMIASLGDLLRVSLSRAGTLEVPLADELELLRLYLDVEQQRFHGRLTVGYDVDPTTRAALVPDLILQPLVENALKHGVDVTGPSAELTIRARRMQERLVLEVQDTGKRASGTAVAPSAGIGLTTTRARLEALYGAGQTFELVRVAGAGVIARITMPFRPAH